MFLNQKKVFVLVKARKKKYKSTKSGSKIRKKYELEITRERKYKNVSTKVCIK